MYVFIYLFIVVGQGMALLVIFDIVSLGIDLTFCCWGSLVMCGI